MEHRLIPFLQVLNIDLQRRGRPYRWLMSGAPTTQNSHPIEGLAFHLLLLNDETKPADAAGADQNRADEKKNDSKTPATTKPSDPDMKRDEPRFDAAAAIRLKMGDGRSAGLPPLPPRKTSYTEALDVPDLVIDSNVGVVLSSGWASDAYPHFPQVAVSSDPRVIAPILMIGEANSRSTATQLASFIAPSGWTADGYTKRGLNMTEIHSTVQELNRIGYHAYPGDCTYTECYCATLFSFCLGCIGGPIAICTRCHWSSVGMERIAQYLYTINQNDLAVRGAKYRYAIARRDRAVPGPNSPGCFDRCMAHKPAEIW